MASKLEETGEILMSIDEILMITKALLQETRTKNSSIIGPIMPSKMPNIRVDMRGLLDYAKKKQIRVEDLTDDERAKFATVI